MLTITWASHAATRIKPASGAIDEVASSHWEVDVPLSKKKLRQGLIVVVTETTRPPRLTLVIMTRRGRGRDHLDKSARLPCLQGRRAALAFECKFTRQRNTQSSRGEAVEDESTQASQHAALATCYT